MLSRRSKAGQDICISLENIDRYLHLIFFYKANMVARVTSQYYLPEIRNNLEDFISVFNSYIKGMGKRKREGRKTADELTLSREDFEKCDVRLSSKEIVEVKEYLKSSKYLYAFKTSETYRTVEGLRKLAAAADRLFRIKIGDSFLLAMIDVGSRDISSRQGVKLVNEEFTSLASGELSYTAAYVLAASLVARHVPRGRAQLVLIRGSYFTSVPIDVSWMQNRLIMKFAGFYINLVKSRSDLVDSVASALLAALHTGEVAYLYEIVRNMAQTKRLNDSERRALQSLLVDIS